MDIRATGPYLPIMLRQIVTLLAIVAITVVTTVASAHAARMSLGSIPDHATHTGAMEHVQDLAKLGCDAANHCGSADAGMCDFVCTGLSAVLTSPGAEVGQRHPSARHDIPSEPAHVGQAPGLNERPPKLRLL